MDRSSPESDQQKKGFRETLRYYWFRTMSAFRAMFTSKQESDEVPASVRSTRGNSCEPLIGSEADYDVPDALSVSGAFTRRWEQLSELNEDQKETSSSTSTFRVVSYNVLCQRTLEAKPELYAHLDSDCCSWSHRWDLLLNEICALKADVLGLQEVPELAFKQCFEPLLESLGYEVLYFETTLEAHNHGLVLAVRQEKFKIESQETIEYYQKEDCVMDRGNIGQIVRVICRKTKASLLLAHTHLLLDPLRGDTKFAQIAYLLSRVHQCRREEEPIVCLGDFNIEPASQLYEYITDGILKATHFNIQHGSGQIPVDSTVVPQPEEFLYDLPRLTLAHTMMDRSGTILNHLFELIYSFNRTLPNQFTHRLNLASAYAPHEPRSVTSFHSGASNPDYIFYDAGSPDSSMLSLTRRLALPTAEDLSGVQAWPNEAIPSDHLCLLAEFALTKC